MFNRLVGALERIQYQNESPLFKDLTDFFQTCIDTLNNDNNFQKLSGDKLQEFVKDSLYAIGFSKKLKAIVENNLKLRLDSVSIQKGCFPNAGMFTSFSNKQLISDIKKPKSSTPKKASVEFQSIIEFLIKRVDSEKGIILDSIEKYYHCDLVLVSGLFTIGSIYPQIGYMSAREIAGVILHELGHSLNHLKELSLAFQKAEKLTSFMQSLSTDLTGDNLKEFANILYRESQRITDVETKRFLNLLVVALINTDKVKYDDTVRIYVTIMITFAFAASFYAEDVLLTNTTRSHVERTTDEWATQHGASVVSVSGQIKLDDFYELYYKSGNRPVASGSDLLSLISAKLTIMRDVFGYLWVQESKDYDTSIRRMKLMVQNTTEELKNKDISPKVRDDIIAAVRECKEFIEAYENRRYVKARQAFWGSLLRISRPGTTIDALTNGNLAADYQRLQELTKDLIQSPFSYHAARLQVLKEKSGS